MGDDDDEIFADADIDADNRNQNGADNDAFASEYDLQHTKCVETHQWYFFVNNDSEDKSGSDDNDDKNWDHQ